MIAPNTHTPNDRHYSRNHPITCKVSPKDLAEIESKAKQSGKSRSSFMRDSALKSTVVPATTVPSVNKDQWEQLSRVASNLNQLTYQCHTNKEHPSSDKVISQIAEVRNILHEVRQTLIGESIKGGRDGG
jgi:uncharacterized protein (DUF1778 family)